MNKTRLFFGGLILSAAISIPLSANAQKRDYMTDQESDVVREAQEIDQRIIVLTKMIDRRFLVLSNAANDSKQIQKENEILGELPKSSRVELLTDINRLLQKAIDDVDTVAEHNRMDSKLFPKAMRKLSESSQKYLPQLQTAFDKSADEKERGVIFRSIEYCHQIIEASAKVPKDVPKDEKNKKSKDDWN